MIFESAIEKGWMKYQYALETVRIYSQSAIEKDLMEFE
jgi:hypothetical protein